MTRMQTLDDLEQAIDRSVRSALRTHPLLEDIVQEAHIAAWQRREQNPETPLGHQLVAARRRAYDVAVGKQQFGAPGRTPGSGSRKPTFASYDAVVEALGEPVTEPVRAAESAILIDEALSALEPEERTITSMMMDGYVHRDIAAHFGLSVAWVRAKMPGIREKLLPFYGDLRAA